MRRKNAIWRKPSSTAHQLAERHQTTIETVKRRQAGLYIAYKLGKHVRYKLSDIVAFENAGRV